MSQTDIKQIKEVGYLATLETNTYLGVSRSVAWAYNLDVNSVGSPLQVVPIDRDVAMQVTDFIPDTTDPNLITYDLDYDSGELTLFFDEPVNIKSFNQTEIVLQGVEQRGSSPLFVQLSEASHVQNPVGLRMGSSVVDIVLSNEDLGSLNSKGLGSYLTASSTTAIDMAHIPNDLVAIIDGSALPVRNVVPDTTGPSVVAFALDMEIGIISLNFSEPVDEDTFDPTKITLQGTNLVSSSDSLSLTASTIVISNEGTVMIIDLAMFRVDFDSIKVKMYNNVADSLGSTFLTIASGAFQDYNGNSGSAIVDGSALQAYKYIPDTVNPTLLSFDLETADSGASDYGKLTLHFSEPVDPTSIIVSNIVLSDADSSDDDTETVTLSSSSVETSSAGVDVVIALAAGELSTIQASSAIASGVGTTFLSIDASSAEDTSGNEMDEVDHLMLGPVLLRSTLNFETGSETIQLIFSEDMKTASFDASGLTLFGEASTLSHTLSDSTLAATTAALTATPVVVIDLGPLDIIALKTFNALGVSKATSRLGIDAALLTDTAATPNPVVPVVFSDYVFVNQFRADATAPVLLSVDVNLNEGTMTFEFDEPIDKNTLALNQITLQSSAAIVGASSVTLADSSYNGINNKTVVVELGYNDLNAIKAKHQLCTQVENCYLSCTADTFRDTALVKNSLVKIASSSPRAINSFVADVSGPVLVNFDINLNDDTLTLLFDEPVLADSFKPWGFRLQRKKSRGTAAYLSNLSNSTTTASTNGTTIVVDLQVSDIEYILLETTLMVDEVSTFIVMDAGALVDMRGNEAISVPDGGAKAVRNYNPDVTEPTLVDFQIDMDRGTLTLVWSEYLEILATDVTLMSIQNASVGTPSYHQLTEASILSQTVSNSKSMDVILSAGDLNALKDNEQLALGKNSSLIRCDRGAVADMSGNKNAEVEPTSAFVASKYSDDVTVPRLDFFDLNMDLGVLSLYFSETMSVNNIVYSDFMLLQSEKVIDGPTVKLSEPRLTAGETSQSNLLQFALSGSDFQALKNSGIGLSRNTSWLTLGPSAVFDMVGLPAEEIVESGITGGQSMRVREITYDMTAPGVEKWRLDRAGKELYVFFTEPVVIDRQKGFRLNNGTASVHLGNCSVNMGDGGTIATFDLGSTFYSSVLNRIVETWDLFVEINMLKAGVGIVLDVSENSFSDLAPVPNTNGLVYKKLEDVSVCDCAAADEFIADVCTSKTDAVCAKCRDCSAGGGKFYEFAKCAGTTDTQCVPCTDCQHLYYPSAVCHGTSDTVCSVCTECSQYEYETSPCTGGNNRICSSCLVCTYLSKAQEIACNAVSQTWRRKNCCFDKDGEQVSCDRVDFANAEIEARNGRHHWVYPDTTPPIAGYGIFEWSGA